MRAWTVVLFILAIHACLAMINVADITNVGLNMSIDTSGGTILVSPGTSNLTVPSSTYFNESANASNPDEARTIANKTLVITGTNGGFVDKMIEQITGAFTSFMKFITTFSTVLFSIHTLGAPIFGDFNAWVLEGMVDIIFGVSLFQMITGRSFKTME